MVDFDARDIGHEQVAARPVHRLISADGEHFLDVILHTNGTFQFVEARLFNEDNMTFVAPVSFSGLYASAADAERDARAVFSWLADARLLEDEG